MSSPKYLSTYRIARMTGFAPRTVTKWCDTGKLKCFRLPPGNHRRILPADLIAFLEGYGVPVPEELRAGSAA